MTPPHLLYLLEVGIITVSVSIYTCTHLQIMISISVKVNHCTFIASTVIILEVVIFTACGTKLTSQGPC
jgi:hypothetical protein